MPRSCIDWSSGFKLHLCPSSAHQWSTFWDPKTYSSFLLWNQLLHEVKPGIVVDMHNNTAFITCHQADLGLIISGSCHKTQFSNIYQKSHIFNEQVILTFINVTESLDMHCNWYQRNGTIKITLQPTPSSHTHKDFWSIMHALFPVLNIKSF